MLVLILINLHLQPTFAQIRLTKLALKVHLWSFYLSNLFIKILFRDPKWKPLLPDPALRLNNSVIPTLFSKFNDPDFLPLYFVTIWVQFPLMCTLSIWNWIFFFVYLREGSQKMSLSAVFSQVSFDFLNLKSNSVSLIKQHRPIFFELCVSYNDNHRGCKCSS